MENQPYITKIQVKKNKFLIFVQYSGTVSGLQGRIHFCNAWLDYSHDLTAIQSSADTLLYSMADIISENRNFFIFQWAALRINCSFAAATGRDMIHFHTV